MDGIINGQYFDKDGQRYIVNNVILYVVNVKDKLLVEIYKATIYQHELLMAIEELKSKKLISVSAVEPYNKQLTLNMIEAIKNELIDRFDIEFHDKVVDSIDLSFLDKKPKNL